MKKNLIIGFILLILLVLVLVSCGEEAGNAAGEQFVEQTESTESGTRIVNTESGGILYFLLALAALFLLAGIIFLLLPFDLWLKTISSGIWIWPLSLIKMRIQHIDLKLVIEYLIKGRKAGVKISLGELEKLYLAQVDIEKVVEGLITAHNGHIHISLKQLKAHYLSGGSVHNVVHAMISAHSADHKLPKESQIHLSFESAAYIDHAGINVAEAIQNYIKPKVIETEEIIGIAKDGVELTAKVRITIRTNIKKIVSGGDEDTIKAQVNEKVVSIIGQSESHKHILESAYEVGEGVMREKDELFKDTAFDVLSVDVSSIKVGKDVHAALEAEKAHAKLAHEKAKEIEMKNLLAEAKIHHLHAESEVQVAMAEAFRDGNLSVKDYKNLMNTDADTIMRKSFSNPPTDDPKNLRSDY